MASSDQDVLAPRSLILPDISNTGGNQLTTAKTGTIGMSGANLVFFNGSDWETVTED